MATPTLDRLIKRLQQGTADPEVADEMQKAFIQGEREIFNSQSSWNGARWKPLKQSTRDQKGGGGRIGRESGALYRSLTGGAGFIRQSSSNQIIFGTRVPYAARFDDERPCLYADPQALTRAYQRGLFRGMEGGG